MTIINYFSVHSINTTPKAEESGFNLTLSIIILICFYLWGLA